MLQNTVSEATRPPSDFDQIMQENAALTGEVLSMVRRLASRLEPVLRPVAPSKDVVAPVGVNPASPIVLAMITRNDTSRATLTTLEGINQRLSI